MKLDPPPKHTMRVHELAKELGWPSHQLIAELRRSGEYVKSAMSTIEAPVVRDIRRDFAATSTGADPDDTIASDCMAVQRSTHTTALTRRSPPHSPESSLNPRTKRLL
jgi:hypothetical protein